MRTSSRSTPDPVRQIRMLALALCAALMPVVAVMSMPAPSTGGVVLHAR